MGHQKDGAPFAAEPVHTLGDDAQGVDVEPRVSLIEQRQLRLEDEHLEDLVALLLTAREADVERAVEQVLVELDRRRPLAHHLQEGHGLHRLAAVPRAAFAALKYRLVIRGIAAGAGEKGLTPASSGSMSSVFPVVDPEPGHLKAGAAGPK